jgi:hypothetical protein
VPHGKGTAGSRRQKAEGRRQMEDGRAQGELAFIGSPFAGRGFGEPRIENWRGRPAKNPGRQSSLSTSRTMIESPHGCLLMAAHRFRTRTRGMMLDFSRFPWRPLQRTPQTAAYRGASSNYSGSRLSGGMSRSSIRNCWLTKIDLHNALG